MEYKTAYSKRQTIAIKIKGTNVTVCAPDAYKNSPRLQKELQGFVEKKRQWIDRKISDYHNSVLNYCDGLLNFTSFYWHGRKIDAEYSPEFKSVKFDGSRLILPESLACATESFKKKLKKALLRQSADELASRLAAMAQNYGFCYSVLEISNARGKWGSCSATKTIRLNWRLSLLSDELIEYVIIHELCHTAQLNHSAKFWCLVQLYCPNYRQLKQQLKHYAFVTEYLR